MKLITNTIVLSIILLSQVYLVKTQDADTSISNGTNSEDQVDFIRFAAKSGYAAESYDVITEDGYILRLFHIPGNKSRPVFMMHGLADSATTFILRENTSLAIALANDDNDVWAGNYRGNKYSRRHLTLNPDTDKKFWNYTFHEIAAYDMTAMIDFILDKTGQQQLSVVAHSAGNTFLYALGVIKPEYNAKIKVMVSLAPICFIENARGAIAPFLPIMPALNALFEASGMEEVLPSNSSISNFTAILCSNNTAGYVVCNNLGNSAISGYDPDQIEPEFSDKVFHHYPAGTSRKNLVHLAQSGRTRKFTQYDYGLIGNYRAYNSSSPPAYDLSKVTMKVALIVGKNDYIVVIKDVKRLRDELANVIEYYEVEPASFNHVDFTWGRDTHKVLYPHVVELLQKYS